MKPFINENFLLENKTAERLFYGFSQNLPVIDFHCHLSPKLIADDHQFENITQVWLDGDHYKWRAMRANGISETFCSGKASDIDKFKSWAKTIPYVIGNPLYHWTHLEMARYFNIFTLLSPSNAQIVYEDTSALLRTKEFSTQSMLRKMKVEVVCTTDDPVDSLEHHNKFRGSALPSLFPTFRPDNILKTEDPGKYISYIRELEKMSGIEVKTFNTLIEALDKRHDFFHKTGARLSDHGLEKFWFAEFKSSEIDSALKRLLDGKTISSGETEKYRTAVMIELCRLNHKRGWTQQFHIGAIRNNSSRMFSIIGADTGWDSIGSTQDASKMSKFLNALDSTDQLAKTILYNMNPADNEMMITMAGSFNDGSSPARVQYGPAWWFLDQKNGIEKHLNDISSFGLLRRFIGMVTDSRSFLSYPRHEYFRRIVCNFIGKEVEKGLIPNDEALLKPLIEGISYTNAKEFLKLVSSK